MTSPAYSDTCGHCGKVMATLPGKVYCSRRCKERAREARQVQCPLSEPVDCGWCGRPFMRDTAGRLYCGAGCAWAAQQRQVREHAVRNRDQIGAVDLRIGWIPRPLATRYHGPLVEALKADPCSYCGADGGGLDHIVPLSREGQNTLDNLTGTCPSCNSSKNSASLLLFLLRERLIDDAAPLLKQVALITGANYANPRQANGASLQPRLLTTPRRRIGRRQGRGAKR